MMQVESNLADNEARIVSGTKGVYGKSFSKKFKNQEAMEKWMDSEAASDCEVYCIERA